MISRLTPSSVAIPPRTISPLRPVVSGGIVDLQRLVERGRRQSAGYGEKLPAGDSCVNAGIAHCVALLSNIYSAISWLKGCQGARSCYQSQAGLDHCRSSTHPCLPYATLRCPFRILILGPARLRLNSSFKTSLPPQRGQTGGSLSGDSDSCLVSSGTGSGGCMRMSSRHNGIIRCRCPPARKP